MSGDLLGMSDGWRQSDSININEFEQHTWMSMACMMGVGPDVKPIRIPAERTLDMLSKRTTRPASGSDASSSKYDLGLGAFP